MENVWLAKTMYSWDYNIKMYLRKILLNLIWVENFYNAGDMIL